MLCQRVLEEEEHYHIIDSLMREDFRIINIRMTWLSTKQATELAGAIGHRSSLSPRYVSLCFLFVCAVGASAWCGDVCGMCGCACVWWWLWLCLCIISEWHSDVDERR